MFIIAFAVYALTIGDVYQIPLVYVFTTVLPNLILMGYCFLTFNKMDDDFFILAEMRRHIKSFIIFIFIIIIIAITNNLIVTINNWNIQRNLYDI